MKNHASTAGSAASVVAGITAGLALGAAALVAVPAAAQAQPPQCTNADLAASYHARDAGAGHRYGVIRLTDVSGRSCSIRGYGGLSYVGGGDGTQVGAPAERDAARVRTVVLDPGEHVTSRVDAVVAQNYPRRRCEPIRVDGFRVYVPDATRSQFVAHRTTGCANPAVHLLGHRPYR